MDLRSEFMHRFSSQSSIARFRFAALLFWFRYLVPIVGVPLLGWCILTDNDEWFRVAVGMLAATPVLVVLQWLIAARVRCPLCLAPPLLHKGCSKNRKARTLFFSYRLRVATTGLFLGFFRCQYCGEPTELKVRERRRGSGADFV